MAWIQDPLKKWIHWTSVALAVVGFVAWGLIASNFRYAWVPIAFFFGIRIALFQYLDAREKKRRSNGDQPVS